MKIKVATPIKKEQPKAQFVKSTKKAKLNIDVQLLVDSLNNISSINYEINGKAKCLKIQNGDIMFHWAEMESDFEAAAKKLKIK